MPPPKSVLFCNVKLGHNIEIGFLVKTMDVIVLIAGE